MTALLEALDLVDVVVCCGPGGVGKTTVSAALSIRLAEEGRRVCVLTVDPARRLAQALGIDGAGGEPVRVPHVAGGGLHAVMLDATQTFDALVVRYAGSVEQAEAIRENRLYRSLSSSLSGTQEYMAMEKLYELVESGRFDVVVVDTPPTRNALDLIDAPTRLTSFLENRIFRALLTPARAYLRAVSLATRTLLATIGKVAGAELVADAVDFFQAFAGMEQGFADRATAIHDRLRQPSTSFVLVTTPRQDAIVEAQFFQDRLRDAGLDAGGVIVNRVHPTFATPPAGPQIPFTSDLGVLMANLQELNELATLERRSLDDLLAAIGDAPVASLPLSSDAAGDVPGLRRLIEHLTDETR